MSTSAALIIADFVGVAVVAASGGSAAVGKRLDVFGVVFVGCVAAWAAGSFATSPSTSLRVDQRSLATKCRRWRSRAIASLLVFWFHPQLARIRRVVLLLDVAGLGLFTAAGTLKALACSAYRSSAPAFSA